MSGRQDVSRYAQVLEDSRVARVVVCTQPAWLHSIDPEGAWIPAGNGSQHAGPGLYWTGETCPVQFIPPWDEPDEDSALSTGELRWHNGQPWESAIDGNTAEPGTGPEWEPYIPPVDGPIVAEPLPTQ